MNITTININISPAWQGAVWKLCACASFAGINTLVRYLSGGSPLFIAQPLPNYVIAFLQHLLAILIILPLIKSNDIVSLKTRYFVWHMLRVLAGVIGIGFWYLTLKYMPIAQGVMLGFMGPIITIAGSILLLKERITWLRGLAIALSVIGAYFLLRSHADTSHGDGLGWLVVLPLIATGSFACNKLITRKLASHGESPKLLALYLLIFMTPCFLIPACFQWVTPQLSHLPYLLLLGVLAAVAHYSFSRAYALAEVTFLMPFGGAKFILSVLVGLLFFAEFPDNLHSWFGMLVIFCGVTLLSYVEQKNHNKTKIT